MASVAQFFFYKEKTFEVALRICVHKQTKFDKSFLDNLVLRVRRNFQLKFKKIWDILPFFLRFLSVLLNFLNVIGWLTFTKFLSQI